MMEEAGEGNNQQQTLSFMDAMIGAITSGSDRHDEFGSLESNEGLIHVSTM